QIGASIDFIAGTVKRTPIWMQKVGLEWFYRFLQEPTRMFRRYFINDSYFLVLVSKEFFKRRRGQ
ncbi:WecB/TagA/CpsF family glycosyltransferase, partial [Bacillus velezensis]|uniref:WecB/TagA/CpsF family glycosyltransferase n=1 Tax=Bacillus velezensis TaxID=492670 RepID=UPI00201C8669